MRPNRLARIVLTACTAFSVLGGVAGCSSSGGSSGGSSASGGLPQSNDPALDKGRTLVETKCTMCHTLDRIKSAQKDAAGWKTTVDRMRGKGAVLTEEEAQQIIDYLASR